MRLVACWLLVSQALVVAQTEQRIFRAEDDRVQHPIEVPASIMAMLAQDLAKDLDLTAFLSDGQKVPTSWFLATEIQLKQREHDIIVIGAGPVLGANVTTFWIFRPQTSGFQLLLKVVAHTIYIENSRTRGYLDLEAASATAVTVSSGIFKFDGNEYILSKSKTSPIQ